MGWPILTLSRGLVRGPVRATGGVPDVPVKTLTAHWERCEPELALAELAVDTLAVFRLYRFAEDGFKLLCPNVLRVRAFAVFGAELFVAIEGKRLLDHQPFFRPGGLVIRRDLTLL
jgi:hypothetical protein